MPHWLVKTEPDVYSIDDLQRDGKIHWTGVRNYQARNYLKEMKRGDTVLFYHSSADVVGIFGTAQVLKEAYPDPEQFDPKSDYYDEKATKIAPRWFCPDLGFCKKLKTPILLKELRAEKKLAKMALLQKGSRLSVTPVTADQWKTIIKMSE